MESITIIHYASPTLTDHGTVRARTRGPAGNSYESNGALGAAHLKSGGTEGSGESGSQSTMNENDVSSKASPD